MPTRVKLEIDEISHFNDVTFEVYRDEESDVTESDLHVMNVDDNTAVRTTKRESMELLTRDPETPYAFFVKRHFKTDTFPEVYIGSKLLDPVDIQLFPEDKMIEIHTGQLGQNDGRNIYMSYEYDSMDVMDDYNVESGKTYFGPPASGLRIPLNVGMIQNLTDNRLEIYYQLDARSVIYFYRIKAVDTDHNTSPLSMTKYIELKPDIVYFRIERSKDGGTTWEKVAFSNMFYWFTDVIAADNPKGLTNTRVTALNSKEARITFDNPWLTYLNDARDPYTYRIRSEDMDGVSSPWFIFSMPQIYVRPKRIKIRRQEDGGLPASENGEDSFTIFDIDVTTFNRTDATIQLIDDQLTDATKYSYTFFYYDLLDKQATPNYLVSDHRMWANLLLYRTQTKSDIVNSSDFLTMFELADRIIEIGE